MASEFIPVHPNDFLTLAKRAGFAYDKLARLLQYSLTASELDMNFSRRVTYQGVKPFRILFAGPLALPVSPVLGVTRKSASDPSKGFVHAYELSKGGTDFNYLPPIDIDELWVNGLLAQGHYAVWIGDNIPRIGE
jgi:hypothetical protein